MLLAWKAQGMMTLAGYILGFPGDTPETIRRDIAIVQKELPLDVVEFFCLTRARLGGPSSLLEQGRCDGAGPQQIRHRTCLRSPPNMSGQEWEAIYHEAWSLYYTPEHMKTLLRRTAATGGPMGSLVKLLFTFSTTDRLEKVHPLQSGIFCLKHPSERRPGLPRESSWVFWPRFVWESFSKHAIMAGTIGRLLLWKMAIARDPNVRAYMDQALTPVRDDEDGFCQVVEAETLIRQRVLLPAPPHRLRRPAPCLSLRPNSRIAAASLDESRPLITDAVAVENVE